MDTNAARNEVKVMVVMDLAASARSWLKIRLFQTVCAQRHANW